MKEDGNHGLSTPVAVIVGCTIISFAILVSGGIITIKGLKTQKDQVIVAPAAQQPAAAAPQGKTEADIINKLKSYASKLGLDQGKFNKCLDSGDMATLVGNDLNDGTAVGVNGTPGSFINGHFISGAQPYSVFKDTIDYELAGGDWDNPTEAVKYLVDGNQGNGEADKKVAKVDGGNLPARGNSSAKVTFIEFSDYQCPFCARFYQETEQQLKKDYIDTGKVKFYYRDYPLTQIHPGAQKGAEAARCAGDQGKYWEFHDLVFGNQQDIF